MPPLTCLLLGQIDYMAGWPGTSFVSHLFRIHFTSQHRGFVATHSAWDNLTFQLIRFSHWETLGKKREICYPNLCARAPCAARSTMPFWLGPCKPLSFATLNHTVKFNLTLCLSDIMPHITHKYSQCCVTFIESFMYTVILQQQYSKSNKDGTSSRHPGSLLIIHPFFALK